MKGERDRNDSVRAQAGTERVEWPAAKTPGENKKESADFGEETNLDKDAQGAVCGPKREGGRSERRRSETW